MELDKFIGLSNTFETYKNMFTPSQQECVAMYLENNFSIVEIAKLGNVTRQAVYKQLSNIFKTLSKLENKLGFHKKSQSLYSKLNDLEQLLDQGNNSKAKKLIKEMKEEI